MTGRWIVGDDGSAAARTALRWATARAASSGDDVVRESVAGDVVAGLVAAADRPGDVLVVGAHPHGEQESILGRIAHRLPVHARCPVVVVPQTTGGRHGPVAAGVGLGPAGDAAVTRAAHEAAGQRVGLVLVRGRTAAGTDVDVRLLGRAGRLAAETCPDLELTLRLSRVGSTEALLVEASSARLLVLGCHRTDDPWRARIGAVGAGVVARAECPVMLVGVD